MNKVKMVLVFLAAISLFSASALANRVFRCLGERVNTGDSTYSVLKKCGDPAYQEIISSESCDKVEKWHYDCYGRGYVEELIFIKGILVEQNKNKGADSTGRQSCNQHAQSPANY